MANDFIKIMDKHKFLSNELIQQKEYKQGLIHVLGNIKNARAYKLWQKIKRVKNLFTKTIFLSKKDRILSLNNIFVTIIINFKYKPSKKLGYFLQSVFIQTFPNIELICLVTKPNTHHTNKLFKQFKKQKNNIKQIKLLKLNLVDVISQAKGKYICYLKPKYILHPNYIEKCVIKMELERLDICSSDTNNQPLLKNKKIFKIDLNKPIIDPEYAVLRKQYLLKIIEIKKPSTSKIKELLIEAA